MSIKTTLLYLIGALVWLAVFSLLQRFCVVSVPWYIEGLWTEQINKNYVKNLAGEVAFHASPQEYNCECKFIYTARYYSNGAGGDYERVSLAGIVDINSWKEIGSDAVSTTYSDKSHRFVLYNNSDGVYMGVFDQ